jgi:hypothetical protein
MIMLKLLTKARERRALAAKFLILITKESQANRMKRVEESRGKR